MPALVAQNAKSASTLAISLICSIQKKLRFQQNGISRTIFIYEATRSSFLRNNKKNRLTKQICTKETTSANCQLLYTGIKKISYLKFAAHFFLEISNLFILSLIANKKFTSVQMTSRRIDQLPDFHLRMLFPMLLSNAPIQA